MNFRTIWDRAQALTALQELARGYAWISLFPSWHAGFLLSLVTFIDPSVGGLGLLGAVCARYSGKLAGADTALRPLCAYNGALTGLLIAHVWYIEPSSVMLVAVATFFVGWVTVVMGRIAWLILGLPILSMPFALTAMLTSASGSSLTTLQFKPYTAPPEFLGGHLDKFLGALSGLYFEPNPYIGLYVFVVMLLFSRYYVLLAIIGYAAALFCLSMLTAAPEHLAVSTWVGCSILASILVGGLFAVPSVLTACLGAIAAIFAAWLALSLQRILETVHLFSYSIPFVLSVWLVLYASLRNYQTADRFNLYFPDFPEKTHERARIQKARTMGLGSVPLALPCSGAWTISQGFSGPHTHHGPWRYALDFIIVRVGKSFAKNGGSLSDFYCFNQPVLSPAYGQVWAVVNDIPDNQPGKVNVAQHWGNFVLIRLYNGTFALVAHLRQWSVAVSPGQWLQPGYLVGYCGNSGRSPQPHIHLQVQVGPALDAPTIPFHLASVLVTDAGSEARYELAIVPKEGALVSTTLEADARPFYLLAGRGLRYRILENEKFVADWTLRCSVDELGRLILQSSGNGSCVVESTWSIFSCYQRSGNNDPYLDIWLLACGFTPTSSQAEKWFDHATPSRMFPHRLVRWLAPIFWPWTTFLESSYQRMWDLEAQAWRQDSIHTTRLFAKTMETRAFLTPQIGCTHISARINDKHYTFELNRFFQCADVGVPGWELTPAISNSLKTANWQRVT